MVDRSEFGDIESRRIPGGECLRDSIGSDSTPEIRDGRGSQMARFVTRSGLEMTDTLNELSVMKREIFDDTPEGPREVVVRVNFGPEYGSHTSTQPWISKTVIHLDTEGLEYRRVACPKTPQSIPDMLKLMEN